MNDLSTQTADFASDGQHSECAICGGHVHHWLFMPIDAQKNEDTPFSQFVKCEACGTGTADPKPEPEQMGELYDLPQYYTHGESHIKEVRSSFIDKVFTKFVWWSDKERPFDIAAMAARIGAGTSVLDIGCGSGDKLVRFKALGHDVAGVEPDQAARDQAALKGVRALPGTGEDLPEELPDASFDLVIMNHSLEHCLNPMASIRGAASKLKPGGLLYIEVPNCDCLHFRKFLACSSNFDSPRHLWFFSRRGLETAVEAAGLQPSEWLYHGLTRHHTRSWRTWETTIADRVAKRGFQGNRHTLMQSVALFVRELMMPPLRKYDAMGVIARK